jgi:hypothetical protein
MAQIVRTQILRTNRPDSCIPSTKAILEALRKLRIDAFAMPVTAMVVNDVLWQYAHDHGQYPVAGSEEYPEDGWGVGVGYIGEDTEPGKWNGHLVAIAERRWLIDVSIDQASRPQHQMVIEHPLVAPVDERWLRSHPGERPLVVQHEQAHVYYWPNPGNDGYKQSNGWSGENAPVVTLSIPKRGRQFIR